MFRCIVELSNKEAANLERSGVWGEGRDLGRYRFTLGSEFPYVRIRIHILTHNCVHIGTVQVQRFNIIFFFRKWKPKLVGERIFLMIAAVLWITVRILWIRIHLKICIAPQ